jgi:flagellar motor switch/type III secretory pathway protein FliN
MNAISSSSLKIVSRGSLDIFDKVRIFEADSFKISFGFWLTSFTSLEIEKKGLLNTKVAWLECDIENLGTIYVPVNDEMFFAHYAISPTQLVAAFRQSTSASHAEQFDQIVLGITRELFPLVGLPSPLRVIVHPAVPKVSTIALFAIESKSVGNTAQGFADISVIHTMLSQYRQLDKRRASIYKQLLMRLTRSCVVNMYSKPLLGVDIEAIDVGSVIVLQTVAFSQDIDAVLCKISTQSVEISLGLSFNQQQGVQIFCASRVTVMDKEENALTLDNIGDEISESVVFEIGKVEMSVAEIAELRPGEVISLKSQSMPFVAIKIGGTEIGRGELVLWNGQVAVQVLDLKNHGQ